MKAILLILLALVAFSYAYSGNDENDKKKKVSKDEVLILGLIEYDFSELENKNISGIMLYMDTKGKLSMLKFPRGYLPKGKQKQYDFISVIGKRGKFSLKYKKNNIHSSETENLLSVLDLEKDPSGRESSILQKYDFKDGNIINLGKISIKYIGGKAEDGRIKYKYTVDHDKKDTLMLGLLEKEYPNVYNTYKNEIYDFYNEFEECVFYIVDHVSEDKKNTILQFLIDNPERITVTFKELSPQNQKEMATTLNKYTKEDLHNFLYSSE